MGGSEAVGKLKFEACFFLKNYLLFHFFCSTFLSPFLTFPIPVSCPPPHLGGAVGRAKNLRGLFFKLKSPPLSAGARR